MNSMKRQKGRTLKDELPGLVGAQYATGDQWRYLGLGLHRQTQLFWGEGRGDGGRVSAFLLQLSLTYLLSGLFFFLIATL